MKKEEEGIFFLSHKQVGIEEQKQELIETLIKLNFQVMELNSIIAKESPSGYKSRSEADFRDIKKQMQLITDNLEI